jgi:hypothetical protein
MSYQFHAWARKGIAANIPLADTLGNSTPPPDVRVKVPLEIDVSGNKILKQFLIAGSGDIIGVATDMIVRTDPRPNSGDFEPNYFASIEFYDEDFPWRYTPAAPVGPNNSNLRPWLMLVVLTEDEFVKTNKSTPLSSIAVTDTSTLPPANELHLWAHVHTNLGDDAETQLEKIIDNLRAKSESDPDGIFSRIICPRKLAPDTLYHAFLVPVFESGRLAGLDLPNDTAPAQQPAWNDEMEQVELPVYYRWQFRTGANLDFETLLRLMQPRKELDPKVGVRDLVCDHPGYIKVTGEGEVPAPSPAVLNMGGAVKQLSTQVNKMDEPLSSQTFIQEIKAHFDLAMQAQNDDKDPVVTIPFYGYHHAKTIFDNAPDFTPDNNTWVNQVNRDPRNRSAAALGTTVIQQEQEKLMQRAWLQLPNVNELNRKIKQLQLAMEVNERMLQGTFAKTGNNTGQVIAMAMPAAARIKEVASLKTIFKTIDDSQVPNATVSAAFRRLSRPNGGIARKLKRTTTDFSIGRVFTIMNPQSIPIFIILPPNWLQATAAINIKQNLPDKLPQIATLQSNISKGTGIVNIAVDQTLFIQQDTIMSVNLPQPISTIKIPVDYHMQVINGLRPVSTLLPAFNSAVSGLPKPPAVQEELLPVMAYPDFPEPAYEYLAKINQDFIVPNLKLVPPNTIALMEPNYDFIHSFLIGLNHEMGRELLWREYPTDQRGTYFRQFWDAGGRRSPEGTDQTVFPYKDIKPIPNWGINTALDNFMTIGRPFPNKPLVLLLKGDLFKKYPNTVVFAQKARKPGSGKLELDDSNDTINLKFPLFSGNLAPDVRLLGFNLTIADVKGDDTGNNLGWFFVLAEVPGEPRFGMDINYTAPEGDAPNTWDNLSLENVSAANAFVLMNDTPVVIKGKAWPHENGQTTDADIDLEMWGRCSADMAGVLLQKPSMMAIHGKELLKDF